MQKYKDIDKVKALTREGFLENYFEKEPVIVQDKISHWKATREWSPQYFSKNYGDEIITLDAYKTGGDKTFLDYVLEDNSREVPFREYIESLESGEHVYSIRDAFQIFNYYPELLEDLSYFSPFCFKEKAKDPEYYKSLWFGPKDYITGLHGDAINITLCHLYGRKRVIIFDLDQTKYLYKEDFDSKELDWEMSEDEVANYKEGTNWGAVDPFNPDYEKFPLLKQASFYEGILEPGEVLYIPDSWWHAVYGLETAISVGVALDPEAFLLE